MEHLTSFVQFYPFLHRKKLGPWLVSFMKFSLSMSKLFNFLQLPCYDTCRSVQVNLSSIGWWTCIDSDGFLIAQTGDISNSHKRYCQVLSSYRVKPDQTGVVGRYVGHATRVTEYPNRIPRRHATLNEVLVLKWFINSISLRVFCFSGEGVVSFGYVHLM